MNKNKKILKINKDKKKLTDKQMNSVLKAMFGIDLMKEENDTRSD